MSAEMGQDGVVQLHTLGPVGCGFAGCPILQATNRDCHYPKPQQRHCEALVHPTTLARRRPPWRAANRPGTPPPAPRTWVGVRVMTKLREMERQSPLPYLARPMRNRLGMGNKMSRDQRGETGGRGNEGEWRVGGAERDAEAYQQSGS